MLAAIFGLHRVCSRLRPTAVHWLSHTGGNVAVITALSALPVITAIGCVVDYSMATMIKTKLQAAADAATLAAVSANSPVVVTAKKMTGAGTVANGASYIQNFFDSNLSAPPATTGYTGLTRTGSASKSGSSITATVSFTATVPTLFLNIIGQPNITLTGQSTSVYGLPSYIDFYLMLDVSASMGMPSTSAEQARLQAVNPDNYGAYPTGCTFACHFTAAGACPQITQGPIPPILSPTNPLLGGYCQGFIISRLGTSPTSFTNGTTNPVNGSKVNWTNPQVSSCQTAGTTSCIQLRLDAVGYAINALLTTANTTETQTGITNQYRVGLFPFIQNLCYANPGSSSSCSVGLTTSLTGSTINNFATQLASQLDNGQNSTLGSGGTHFENALNTMNKTVIPNPAGIGTSSNPMPYLFIITDGSQDYQIQSNLSWSSQNWNASGAVPFPNSATVIMPNSVTSTDYCTTLKNRGVTIAILYIPYQTILNPNPAFANNEDGYANNNIAGITPALQNCASNNYFFTANSPSDIQNALIQMFQQAAGTAHVTQ
jgi:Flp pilus assembly protein TadG